MSAKELWQYFSETESYTLKSEKALEGFMPDWIGEFYAYYQWFCAVPNIHLYIYYNELQYITARDSAKNG